MDWQGFAREFEEITDARVDGSSERWKAKFAVGGTFQDPVQGPTTDYDAVIHVTQTATPDWHMKVTHIAGGQTSAALEWIGEATLLGRVPITVHGCSVIEVDDVGLVTRWRDYMDLKAIENQAADAFREAGG